MRNRGRLVHYTPGFTPLYSVLHLHFALFSSRTDHFESDIHAVFLSMFPLYIFNLFPLSFNFIGAAEEEEEKTRKKPRAKEKK